MIVLGLTGSIGMGKSTTAALFAEAGVPVYDADATVHMLYEGEAVPAIEAAFPGTTANGKVDRNKLSARVVHDPVAINGWMRWWWSRPRRNFSASESWRATT